MATLHGPLPHMDIHACHDVSMPTGRRRTHDSSLGHATDSRVPSAAVQARGGGAMILELEPADSLGPGKPAVRGWRSSQGAAALLVLSLPALGGRDTGFCSH